MPGWWVEARDDDPPWFVQGFTSVKRCWPGPDKAFSKARASAAAPSAGSSKDTDSLDTNSRRTRTGDCFPCGGGLMTTLRILFTGSSVRWMKGCTSIFARRFLVGSG